MVQVASVDGDWGPLSLRKVKQAILSKSWDSEEEIKGLNKMRRSNL